MLQRYAVTRVGDSPLERVVGDLFPAVLADDAVRATGELLVLHDRGAAGRGVLLHDGLADRRRHDVVDLTGEDEQRRAVCAGVVDVGDAALLVQHRETPSKKTRL